MKMFPCKFCGAKGTRSNQGGIDGAPEWEVFVRHKNNCPVRTEGVFQDGKTWHKQSDWVNFYSGVPFDGIEDTREQDLIKIIAVTLARRYHDGWKNPDKAMSWERYQAASLQNWLSAARGIIHLVKRSTCREKQSLIAFSTSSTGRKRGKKSSRAKGK